MPEEKDYSAIGRSILLKRASEGKPTGIPDIPIWQPPGGWADQNFPLPKPPSTHVEQSINDLMKLPPDWDYKNPEQLGPRGELLPEDAIGWTPHATPYYGPGLAGWWKGTVSRLNAPISYESDTIIPQAEPGEELPWYQKALGTLENLGAKFYNAAAEEGGVPSPLTYVTRGVSEVVKSVLEAAQVPSRVTEQTFGVARAVEEKAAEEFGLPEPEYKPFFEGYNPFQEFNAFTSPTGWAFKLGQMLGAGMLTKDETYDMVSEGWNTGRIFYTTVADPLVAGEYKRRYQDKEDPVLLAMELENPMAELVGQVVLDPLNLLGFGARKLKDARKIGSVADDYFKVAPEIDKMLKTAGEVDDLTAVDKIQELVRAIIKSFDDLKNDYRISALTADGKRYVVSRKTNELAEWTIRTNSGNDPDKAMEIIRGTIMLSSDDADEVATGVSLIRGAAIEPSPYFSRAGQEMSVTLRNLVGVDDAGKLTPTKFLDDLAKAADEGVKIGEDVLKGVDGVAYHISQKMDDTINKMFPTITERIKAGEKLPFALKQLARFDAIAQKSVYKPINTFFAGIYMGLSPGYAMRNLFTNTIHVLVDHGPGALRYKPSTLIKQTSKLLGGQVPDVAGFGKGVMGAEVIEAVTRRLPMSRASETFEQWGAVQTVSRSVKDTMHKMLKPGRALPDVAPLINAGMDSESANLLMRLVVNNQGDVKKATSAFKEMVSKGNIDAFHTLGWMTEGNTKALLGFGLTDDFAEAITGATSRDDAFARLNKIFDDIFADSARASDEMPVASEVAEAVDIIDDLASAKVAGIDISDDLIESATNNIEANSQAMHAMERTITDLWNSATARSLDDPEKLRELNVFRQNNRDLFDGLLKSKAEVRHADFREVTNGWNDMLLGTNKNTPQATLKKWWKEIGIPGEPPSDLTLKSLKKVHWEEHYFPKARRHWEEVRDTLYEMSENVVTELNEMVPFDNVMNASLDEPRRLQRYAQTWDEFLANSEVRFAIDKAVKRKDNALVARIYANQFGIPSVSETGTPLDQMILNFINKNIPEGRYATLADVPPEVSRKALLTHATKDVVGEAAPAVAKAPVEEVAPAVELSEEVMIAWRANERAKVRLKEVKALPSSHPTRGSQLQDAENAGRGAGMRLSGILKEEGLTRDGVRRALGIEAVGKAPAEVVTQPSLWDIPDEKLDEVLRVPRPEGTPYAGNTPTMARVVEQQTDGLRNLQDELLRGIDDNWGRVVPQGWSNDLEKAFNVWEKGAVKGVAKARLIAVDVANAARDFTMLSYPQKKYFDLALAYIYPYHFWYNRTYSNWLKRIVTNPEVVAGYGKYKNTLAKIHAGAPEWWKYNINSNELLGMDSENPLFFNLETTLNPLYGLTGVDFTDNKKRVNWWTAALDDVNKFGPSTWTPYSIATALSLYMQGDEEAASRWGGRLIPQTAALKNLTSVMNIGPPGGVELDPNVLFFSGGIDPYERRRVGRAIGSLMDEGLVDPASGIDAAYLQEGDVWDMARERASSTRAVGQLTSFLFGTGFKARNATDIEIDIFDAEYFNLWAMEDNLDWKEFKKAMDELRADYPFMDAVLLSRKAGLARDRGFAYNVLSRIPPGQKDDISDAAGLDYDYIQKFYEDKGHIEDWEETDKQRFMAFVVDVGAILDMPDEATKSEWKMVVGRYSKMMDKMEDYFGEDIKENGIDRFWVIRRDEGDEAGYAFLEANPLVGQAMTWKDATLINDPLMGQYYASINTIERYYNGVMYDAIEHEFSKDIWAIEDGYFEAKLLGKKQAKQYLTEFPQLKEKWDLKDKYEKITSEHIVGVEKMLRSDVHPFLRAGAEARSIAQENIMDVLQNIEQTPYEISWQDFRQDMSPHLQSLVEDYVLYNEELSPAAYDQIDYIARDYNMNADTILEIIRRSMIPEREPQAALPFTPQEEIAPRSPTRHREPGEPMWAQQDERLSSKAKDIIKRNTMQFWVGHLPGIAKQVPEGASFAFGLPESIAKREESGFRRFGVGYQAGIDEEVYLHELAHTIDFVENISSKPEFIKDAERYEREEEPDWSWETNNAEWFAMLFARAVTGNQEVPDYMMKWFKPYIK